MYAWEVSPHHYLSYSAWGFRSGTHRKTWRNARNFSNIRVLNFVYIVCCLLCLWIPDRNSLKNRTERPPILKFPGTQYRCNVFPQEPPWSTPFLMILAPIWHQSEFIWAALGTFGHHFGSLNPNLYDLGILWTSCWKQDENNPIHVPPLCTLVPLQWPRGSSQCGQTIAPANVFSRSPQTLQNVSGDPSGT